MKKKWIIGTRGSKLALIQTDIVRDGLLRLYPEMEFTIKVIKTTGDSIWDTPLYLIGSKGLFIKEIEEELAAGGIDLAVHSVKDLPTELSDGLRLSAVLKREDPRDAFVSLKYDTLLGVRQGARIGTSSMRRKAQIAALRPDIEVVPLRGNVDTRVRKLEAGDLDAVILACAGVMRMGLRESIKEAIPLDIMVPPCGQGAIGIEARSATEADELVRPLDHDATAFEVGLERRLLAGIGGGCSVPLGVNAQLSGNRVIMRTVYGEEDGKILFRDTMQGDRAEGKTIADRLVSELVRARGESAH
jgi:hydroxymethylbilane synthase